MPDDDWEAKVEEIRAEVFGERKKADAHRAWVDHDAIEKCVREGYGLKSLWSRTGLDAIGARGGLPADLRYLLRAYDQENVWVAAPALLTGVLVATALYLGGIVEAGGAFVITFVAGFPLAALSDPITDTIGGLIGRPFPLRQEWRVLRAVKRLREAPFAVVVDGLLVENLPSLSWLRARDEDLEEAASDAERRKRTLEDTSRQIRAARASLGEHGKDVALERLAEAVRAQDGLLERIARLRKDIAARSAKLQEGLSALRARVALEGLRSEAAALTGAPVPSIPEKIAADLEVDVADLRKDFEGLRDDLAEQKLRMAAMNEVSALSP